MKLLRWFCVSQTVDFLLLVLALLSFLAPSQARAQTWGGPGTQNPKTGSIPQAQYCVDLTPGATFGNPISCGGTGGGGGSAGPVYGPDSTGGAPTKPPILNGFVNAGGNVTQVAPSTPLPTVGATYGPDAAGAPPTKPPMVNGFINAGGNVAAVAPSTPLPTSDTTNSGYNAPATGESAAMTPGGAAVAAGRALKANCTVAGNIVVTYADGSTGTWVLQVGTNLLPISSTGVASATSTCTYNNVK